MILVVTGYLIIMAMLAWVIRGLLKSLDEAPLTEKPFLYAVTFVFVFMGTALTVAGAVAISMRAGVS
jgi:hypothetical protein